MNISNQVSLIGNVGQPPTLNTKTNGVSVINFNLATNDYYTNKHGEKVQTTEWHNIVAFGKLATTLHSLIEQGTKLAIHGKIIYSKWVDKNDTKRVTVQIQVNEFTILAGKKAYDDDNR